MLDLDDVRDGFLDLLDGLRGHGFHDDGLFDGFLDDLSGFFRGLLHDFLGLRLHLERFCTVAGGRDLDQFRVLDAFFGDLGGLGQAFSENRGSHGVGRAFDRGFGICSHGNGLVHQIAHVVIGCSRGGQVFHPGTVLSVRAYLFRNNWRMKLEKRRSRP